MEDKNKSIDYQMFFIRLFGLFIILLGCAGFFLLFFYVPLLKSLGFSAVLCGTIALSIFCIACSKSGFAYVTRQSSDNSTSWFELISVYIISLFSLIVSVVCFLKIISWACLYFLNLNVQWLFFPGQ